MTVIHFDKNNPSDLKPAHEPCRVIPIGCITTMPIEPDKVLSGAIGKLSEACVIGWDNEGKFYFASSHPDGGNLLWLLEMAKHRLINSSLEE